jgi:acyl dehydratase
MTSITTAGPSAGAAGNVFSLDLDDLVPGRRFRSRGRTVTESDVVGFAGLTGDRHPQHVDAQWAARSRFGSRIAHGMLVLSYALGLVPLDPDRIVALRGIRNATFKRPVHIGDTVHVEGGIARIVPVDAGMGLVALDWTVVNQRGEAVVRATFEVLWRRGQDAEVPADEDGDEGAPDVRRYGDSLVLPL